jgi:hypothetical protein
MGGVVRDTGQARDHETNLSARPPLVREAVGARAEGEGSTDASKILVIQTRPTAADGGCPEGLGTAG